MPISKTVYLWENEYFKENPLNSLESNRVYEDDIIKIVNVENPSMDIFEPKPIENNGIGIIVCPGGGYNLLAIDLEGYEIAQWLNKLGYTVFVLKYSVPNKQENALFDIQRAVRLLRSNSNKFGIDSEKIGVLGFSAGGNLCAKLSSIESDKLYPKIDEHDDVSCLPNFSLLIYPAYLDEGTKRSLSSNIKINKNTPPMFIFGTSGDIHGNSSLVMTQALRNSEVPIELHFLNEGGHGYGLRRGNNAAETWPILAESWLNKLF